MKIKLLIVLCCIAILCGLYMEFFYKKLNKEVFAGLSLGVTTRQFDQQLKLNSKLSRFNNGVYYYTFFTEDYTPKVFYGRVDAYYNSDSLITRIVINITQRKSELQNLGIAEETNNMIEPNITDNLTDRDVPSPSEITKFLEDYYSKQNYKETPFLQVPVHINSELFGDNIYSFTKDEIKVIMSDLSTYKPPITLPYNTPISRIKLTFQFTEAFMQRNNLYNKQTSNPF